MSEQPPAVFEEPAISPRVDLATAAVLLVLAVGVLKIAIGMPTFAEKGASLFLAPGIVPGFYGGVLVLLSLVLAARSIARGALRPGRAAPARPAGGQSWLRLAIAAGLCFGFAVLLVGALPFWLAAAIFISTFVIIFEWPPGGRIGNRLRPMASAVLLGLVAGGAIHYVFQQIFLVRLP